MWHYTHGPRVGTEMNILVRKGAIAGGRLSVHMFERAHVFLAENTGGHQ